MAANPERVVVTDYACTTCGVERIAVHHEDLPELRLSGPSAAEAAERLVRRLRSSLDVVVIPAKRLPVERAIDDVRAFVELEKALHEACHP